MKVILEEVFPEYVHSYGNVISIPILDTDEINAMIDEERAANGMRPFFDEINGLLPDVDGWYEVRLILDRKTFLPQEIEAWVAPDCGAEEEDDDVYHFEVEDKVAVKDDLLLQMKEFGITIGELRETGTTDAEFEVIGYENVMEFEED